MLDERHLQHQLTDEQRRGLKRGRVFHRRKRLAADTG